MLASRCTYPRPDGTCSSAARSASERGPVPYFDGSLIATILIAFLRSTTGRNQMRPLSNITPCWFAERLSSFACAIACFSDASKIWP